MQIRTMTKADLPALAVLYEQFWGEQSDPAKMEQSFDAMQQEGPHFLLCAVAGAAQLGSGMGVVCRELYGTCAPFLVIENMIVDRGVRCNGIGRALIKELESLARERNCTQMILVTERDRTDACGFYESYGFQRDIAGYKKKL